MSPLPIAMPTAAPLSIAHATLADRLLPAVREAARIQMRYFRSGTAIVTKADASPVTAADRESEAVILAALAAIAPDVPVVAEEAMADGCSPELVKAAAQEFFLVDPLDGTREFIADRPDFTINIALVRNGAPRFGIIYAPALECLYATLADNLAVTCRLEPRQNATCFADLAATPIKSREPPQDGLVAVASRSHGSAGTEAFLGQYPIARRTAAGSSLKFCLVAKGEADIYPRVGATNEWDTAAGQAILTAAGGCVTTLDGTLLTCGHSERRFRNPDYVAWGRTPLPPRY